MPGVPAAHVSLMFFASAFAFDLVAAGTDLVPFATVSQQTPPYNQKRTTVLFFSPADYFQEWPKRV